METSLYRSIHYLHKSHNTPLLPSKNLHRHCFRLLLGHFHVPGEIANNGYANVLGGNRGVLWDCASSEYIVFSHVTKMDANLMKQKKLFV